MFILHSDSYWTLDLNLISELDTICLHSMYRLSSEHRLSYCVYVVSNVGPIRACDIPDTSDATVLLSYGSIIVLLESNGKYTTLEEAKVLLEKWRRE